jgi:AraC-like DNA-binding protein
MRCRELYILIIKPLSHPSSPHEPRGVRLSEWATLEAHLLWIYDGRARFPGREGLAVNEQLSAWLVRKGSVLIRIADQEATVRQGEWIFLGQEKRWQRFSPDCQMLSIRFCAHWPSGEDILPRKQCSIIHAAEVPQLERSALKMLRIVRRHFRRSLVFLMQQCGSLDAHLDISAAFYDWLRIYMKIQNKLGCPATHGCMLDSRVQRVHDLVLNHPLSEPFKEREAATSVGLSTIQLNRLFVKQFGRTVRRSLEERRMEQAIAALSGTSAPIKQIAFDLGFGSLPHFSTWFHRKKGVYPQLYRKSGNMFF